MRSTDVTSGSASRPRAASSTLSGKGPTPPSTLVPPEAAGGEQRCLLREVGEIHVVSPESEQLPGPGAQQSVCLAIPFRFR